MKCHSSRTEPFIRSILFRRIFAVATLFFAPFTHAASSTFYEGFDGSFSQAWNSSPGALPPVPLDPFRAQTVLDAGAPTFSFATVDGYSVLRMNTMAAPSWTRFGFRSEATVGGASLELEARINTLNQGGLNIDGLFDVWLINSQDPAKYVQVGMFGDQFGTRRAWYAYGSGGPFLMPDFAYASYTWYKLRITANPGQNLEVSIWNDAGNAKLVSHTFDYQLGSLGSDFNIAFSQWMGGPNQTYSMLSAVDYIQLVPEPTTFPLIGVAALSLFITQIWRRNAAQNRAGAT